MFGTIPLRGISGLLLIVALSVVASRQSSIGAKKKAPIMSRVEVNTCTVEELQQLPGIGEVKAKAIVAAREQVGLQRSA